jgi:hypothetical protein
METPMKIQVRFVPKGSKAPEKMEPDELWLDVGGRASSRVVDHHGGDIVEWSAMELLFQRHDTLIPPILHKAEALTLVLHEHPDLDAIGSTWLARLILKDQLNPDIHDSVARIVAMVSENDQGYVRSSDPSQNWPLVMRSRIYSEYRDLRDSDILQKGLQDFDKTLSLLDASASVEEIAHQLVTPLVQAEFNRAVSDYWDDRSRGTVFQLRLPTQTLTRTIQTVPDGPVSEPDPHNPRRALADGLLLLNPSEILLRELARGDKQNSLCGNGFNLMIVVHDVPPNPYGLKQRYIISTDPLSGMHLKGLGAQLELEEQRLEQREGNLIPPERALLPEGEGRFQSRREQPWYDGRGHNFTILDCPGISVDNQTIYGSRLSNDAMLRVVWRYGDPARCIRVIEGRVELLQAVQLQSGWSNGWESESVPSIFLNYLSAEASCILNSVRVYHPVVCTTEQTKQDSYHDGLDQHLIVFDEDHAILVRELTLQENRLNLRELTATVYNILQEESTSGLSSTHFIPFGECIHFCHLRLDPNDVSLGLESSSVLQALLRLANGDDPQIPCPYQEDIHETASVIRSRDSRNLLLGTPRGILGISTRQTLLDQEHDFHRSDCLSMLIGFVLHQKAVLKSIIIDFSEHAADYGYKDNHPAIIEDRHRLMEADRRMTFGRISEHRFGERSYHLLRDLWGIKGLRQQARDTIEVIADHVNDQKAEFYQRLSFWISILFAPLIITSGIFSGLQFTRGYTSHYISLFPKNFAGIFDGWLMFLSVFILIALLTAIVWAVIRQRRKRR